MTPIGRNCRIFTASSLAAAAAAALALGSGCGGEEEDSVDPGSANPDSELTLEEARAPVADADPALASLREQANEILDGGKDGFDSRLAELEAAGIPVVVNKWASWCGPCREEFPDFQAQAIERGNEVAFLGLLSNDGPETGETFLSELPLPYPSYLDSDQEIAFDRGIAREFPTTVFIASDGEVAHTKVGPYTSEDELAADIERYAQ
ncbi:MAG: TlpA family protein disulfide reductase [Actinomycetota bacterium]|nr:TlpA family protein disulfide reductase [Actinomycetota bacterium]